jgi:predicted transposase/invertase (TIGR01784 family)
MQNLICKKHGITIKLFMLYSRGMANKISPHDKFFKITMMRPRVAKKFLAKYLPEHIKTNIDLNTLTLEKESFIDQNMKGLFVDLLYSAKFKGKRGRIYILFEHLSNPDKKIAFRLLKYMINIMDHHLLSNKKLPIIFPIILYTGKDNRIHVIDIFDLFGEDKELARNILLNPYYILNINEIKESDLKDQHHFATMIQAYKCRFYKQYKILKSLIPHLKRIEKISDLDYIASTFKYIAETSDIVDHNKFFKEIYNSLSKKTEGEIMTIAERLRQEGRQQGERNGKQKAFERVAISLLKRQRPLAEIVDITGLTKKKIKKLAEEKGKN